MPSEPAVLVENLSKQYRVYRRPSDRIAEWLLRRPRHQVHPALEGISFRVERGETFGIVGRNGSGKSTLLQILAGITYPTSGSVSVACRVSPLLQIGAGFNVELTGRDNIMHAASYHGAPAAMVAGKVEEIAAFADIGEYLDRPVKTYSSGMFVRLAFAITTCLEPELLLVDEVLAVGDVFFRQKCFRRMEELKARGTSIVFVSHDMSEVGQLCRRALVLDRGRARFIGDAREAVAHYLVRFQAASPSEGASTEAVAARPEPAAATPAIPESTIDLEGTRQVSTAGDFLSVSIADAHSRPTVRVGQGEKLTLAFAFRCDREVEVPLGGVMLWNHKGVFVFGTNNLLLAAGDPPPPVHAGSEVRFTYTIRMAVEPGEYTLTLGFAAISRADYDRRHQLTHADLHSRVEELARLEGVALAVDLRPPAYPAQMGHYGLAELSTTLDGVRVVQRARAG